MTPQKRLLLSILLILAVVAVGSAGYMVIERKNGLSVLDAIYITVITVSTVGYSEMFQPSFEARLWTLGVIVFGIGTVSVAFTSLITLFVSGELRFLRETRKMESTIRNLKNHVILCGYGRMGELAVKEMARQGLRVVVVEHLESLTAVLRERQILHILGDATEDEVLEKAGIMRARALVTALPSDADNVYITLTARTIRTDLQIIARAEQPASEAKLKRAGASRVVCTQVMGALRISNILTRPNVVDLVEMANKGVDLEIDEYVVTAQSAFMGQTLRESKLREETGASVVAIKQNDGETVFNPGPDSVLSAGDTLVFVGPAGVSNRLDNIE